MAKIEQEVKEMKEAIIKLDDKIGKLQFFLVQIMNKLGEEGTAVGVTSTATPSSVNVDITPLEERLAQLTNIMATKADIEPVVQGLAKLHDERIKEADDTIDNVTALLEKGLALTELTASLKTIEAHLQELITPPK